MLRQNFKRGDIVVYRKAKCTTSPGRRAQIVHAATKGDYYRYFVDKFWIVGEVLDDGKLLLLTRRGKTHVVDRSDHNLRQLTWLDRIFNRGKIVELGQSDPVYG